MFAGVRSLTRSTGLGGACGKHCGGHEQEPRDHSRGDAAADAAVGGEVEAPEGPSAGQAHA